MPRPKLQEIVIGLAGAVLVGFLVLPLMGLVASTGPRAVLDGLSHPLVAPALRLSVQTTFITTALLVLVGTPLAWTLARSRGRWSQGLESLLQLPAVLPPSVAGVALLVAFGRQGLVGGLGGGDGASLAFTTTAVVLAQAFVAAPYFLQAATTAFRQIDPALLLVARSMGAPPFTVFSRIALPLARPGLFAGAVMAWARALGEFGATLMFAGNLEGRTQTLPLAIYTALETDLRAAQALSLLLMLVAFGVLIVSRRALGETGGRRD
jgi:molybdate transport system permease protein